MISTDSVVLGLVYILYFRLYLLLFLSANDFIIMYMVYFRTTTIDLVQSEGISNRDCIGWRCSSISDGGGKRGWRLWQHNRGLHSSQKGPVHFHHKYLRTVGRSSIRHYEGRCIYGRAARYRQQDMDLCTYHSTSDSVFDGRK